MNSWPVFKVGDLLRSKFTLGNFLTRGEKYLVLEYHPQMGYYDDATVLGDDGFKVRLPADHFDRIK